MGEKVFLPFVKLEPISNLPETSVLSPGGNIMIELADGTAVRMTTDVFYQVLNNIARPIAPSDSGPFTANSWHKPTTSAADPGTNYPNAGNLKARNGYDTLFWYNGTAWIKTEVALPSGKTDTWLAGSYATGKQVINPADQSIYEANADVIATDVPGVSSKWTKKVGGNSNNTFNNNLYKKSGSNISDIVVDPVWPATGMVIDSNGLTIQDKGVILNLQTNLNKRFIELRVKLNSDSIFYIGTKNVEVSVGENVGYINCSTGKLKINDLFSSGSIEKNIPFAIVSGREYIVRFYKIDNITRLELVDTVTSLSESVQISQLGHFDKYKFGLDQPSTITIKSIGVYSIYKQQPFIGFYGDSNTEGNNVADISKSPYYKDRFANLIGDKLGKEYYVSARSGGNIDGVLARMKVELPVLKPTYVFVTIGTNGGNTEAKLNELVDYCQSLNIKVILNSIPLTDSNSVGRNTMIQTIVNQKGLLSVRTDIATSVNNDGITKNTSLYISENSTYVHLNTDGNLAMYKRALVDIASVFDEAASEVTVLSNSGTSKVESVLKYFLEQPAGVESLDLTFNLLQSNNSSIYGVAIQGNSILRTNNTLVTYSETGSSYVVYKDIQLLQGIKKITRIVLDIIQIGNSPGGTNATLVGVKADGTISPLIVYSTTPAPTTIQHFDIDVSQYKSISIGMVISTGSTPSNPNTLNQSIKFYTQLINGDEDGVKKYVDTQITSSSGRLNVKNEGAKGDGVTDDTAAINAAIVKLVNKGGGELYFPGGVYLVSQVIIPAMSDWQNIVLSGEFIPAQRFGTIVITTPAPDVTKYNGTVIKSLSTTANGVIRCNSLSGGFEGISVGSLTVKNMTIRTYNNPQISGIDAWYIGQLHVENVMIDTGIYNVNASEPTKVVSGIVTPKNSNNALTYLQNICISGYYYGILAYEHTNGDSLQIQSCKHALVLEFASHASLFTRCCFQRNTNQVTVLNEHIFQITQLNMEYAGSGQTDSNNAWQATQYELNDPNSKGIGNIAYANVKGALGSVTTFRMNGGNKVIVKRIGNETRITTTIPSP